MVGTLYLYIICYNIYNYLKKYFHLINKHIMHIDHLTCKKITKSKENNYSFNIISFYRLSLFI